MSQKWIPVGRAKVLHIPYFAMGSAGSREAKIINRENRGDLLRLIGSKCCDWLNLEHRSINFCETRNYIPPRTAFYQTWLAFYDGALADAFLGAFPRLNPDNRITSLKKDAERISVARTQRIDRGGYDIGKHPADQRRAIANHYIKLDEELQNLSTEITEIELTKTLAPQWSVT